MTHVEINTVNDVLSIMHNGEECELAHATHKPHSFLGMVVGEDVGEYKQVCIRSAQHANYNIMDFDFCGRTLAHFVSDKNVLLIHKKHLKLT